MVSRAGKESRLLARSSHTNEHRECLLPGTLRKSRFSAVKAVVDPSGHLSVNRDQFAVQT
jgi:hypothetical protein